MLLWNTKELEKTSEKREKHKREGGMLVFLSCLFPLAFYSFLCGTCALVKTGAALPSLPGVTKQVHTG